MKDRIGNVLAKGDKVVVALAEAQIFGFVAETTEPGLITGVRGPKGTELTPGRVLVSCIIAVPVDPNMGIVAQMVKVYDADKHLDGDVQTAAPKLVELPERAN
jgi:hypothetical protein